MAGVLVLGLLLSGCAEKKVAGHASEASAPLAPVTLAYPVEDVPLTPGPQLILGKAQGTSEVTIEVGGREEKIPVLSDGTFATLREIDAANHVVKVRAAGREDVIHSLQMAPVPWISLDGLENIMPVRAGQLAVVGKVTPSAVSLEIQGDGVRFQNGAFRHSLPLAVEGIVPVRVEAVSATGERQLLVRAVRTDRVPPHLELVVSSPFINSESVQLELRTNEPLEWVELAGERKSLGGALSAGATVSLSEGPNLIEARAADLAGNLSSTGITVIRDTRPPALALCSPSAPARALPVRVRCEASEPLGSAAVGGSVARVEGAFLEAEVGALQDGAHELSIALKDRAGNEFKTSHQLVIDTKPPVIQMYSPPGGETITEDFILAGRTEIGASVFINDAPVPVLGGLFSRKMNLPAGDHPFNIRAKDAAGNESTLNWNLDVDPAPKRFLRQTGEVSKDFSPPQVEIESPVEKKIYGESAPLRLSPVSGLALSITLNGMPLLASLPLPAGEEKLAIEDVLDKAALQEGENFLEVIVTGERNKQEIRNVHFRLDSAAPRIVWKNFLPGEQFGGLVPDFEVKDESLLQTSLTLDGELLRPGSGITVQRNGAGSHEICITAKDAAGNQARECRVVVLAERPFSFRRGEDPRVSPEAPVRKKLLDPMLEDLVRSGLLSDLLLGNIDLLMDATVAFYPSLSDGLSAFQSVMAEQAASGELGNALRGVLAFQRDGTWPALEDHLAALLTAPADGEISALAGLTRAGDVYLPHSPGEVLALDTLLAVPLGERVKGPLAIFPEALGVIAESNPKAWNAFFEWAQRVSQSEFPAELARLGRATTSPGSDGESDFDRVLPVIRALLGDGESGALPRLVQAYIEATTGTPTQADRDAFRETIGNFLVVVGNPEFLEALGEMLDSPLLEATQEYLRRSIERGDLPLLTRTLSEISLKPSPRDPDELVLTASLRALEKLWQRDRRDPSRTYAGTIAEAFGALLQKGNDGLSTVDDFIAVLQKTNELDRKRLGTIFVQHSKANERGPDPFANHLPTDAERLMNLFKFANSPLNCGAPVPFTGKVIPLNVPGLPMLFPTDNLMTELLEASTYFDADTVLQLARLMPKFARLMTMGDAFCEPEIVGDLLSDVEVLEANLNHPMLPELLRLGRRMVFRKQHHAVVRMLTAFADADVLAGGIPFMAALYLGDGAEKLYQVSVRQSSWKLEARPQVTALTHGLEAAAEALRPRKGKLSPLAVAVDHLQPLFIGEARPQTGRVLRHLAQRLVMNESEPGLGRLDLLFAQMLAADPQAAGAKNLARLLDKDPANGEIIPVIASIPAPGSSSAVLWNELPFLTRKLWTAQSIQQFLEASRRFIEINAGSGGSLRWIVSNAFIQPMDGGRSPMEETFRALAPVFGIVAHHQKDWRKWAQSEGMPLLLDGLRMWTRQRPSGPPHLLRVRDLLSQMAALRAPDGDGLFVDRATQVIAKAEERGFLRTLVETLGRLEQSGYLDRKNPSVMEWIGAAAPAQRSNPANR